jgi:hypothetical protein
VVLIERQYRARFAPHAIALFFIAAVIAVSIAPRAPPATNCEMRPLILKLPECAAATIDGSANVAI